MTISYNWLQQFIELTEDPEQVGRMLTSTGLEVEGIERIEAIKGGLEGVVIGTVLTCEPHPDADKLRLTTVDVGGETPLNIVCGAPNVAAGQRVVVALVGATLYPSDGEPLTIKKAKIRGAASEGMLCAEDEIGLGQSHAGIMVLTTDVPNGTPAAQYFKLEPDYQIAIGLTPNRIDAASHWGVARDLHALTGRPLCMASVDAFTVENTDLTLDVRVETPEACPRYAGVTLSGLTVRESPEWLKKRLLSIGLTPINNIVDVTNFICHDLGQPLHAFDADQIEGGAVVVKTLPEGTPFVTLDGQERKLKATDLMICNGNPDTAGMCIAGVFGGRKSGVSDQTTRIFLESAHFGAASVRQTVQAHDLRTDASFRFERGTDPNLPIYALKRAALLIQEVAGGNISSDIVDIYPDPVQPFRVPVRYRNIDRLIGIKIDRDRIAQILNALDIQLEQVRPEPENDVPDREAGFVAIVPPYRVDVTREADVIEEILRIYGVDNVPLSATLQAESLSEFPAVDVNQLQARVGQVMAGSGFFEIMSLSLTRPAYHDAIRTSLPGADVAMLNPLSDELSVMRQTLLFSALEAMVYNLNRRQKDLKFFEFGKVYHEKEVVQNGADPGSVAGRKYVETMRMSLAMVGNTQAENWQQKVQPVAFHDLAQAVQRVLSSLRVRQFDTQPTDSPLFQYGLTYVVNKKPLVSLGLVNPKLTKLVDLKQPVFYADFDWQAIVKQYSGKAKYEEVPRFPDVRRDLSLVLDKGTNFDQISKLAHQTERKLLKTVQVFDVYEGENLGAGKKSYSVSFLLQDPTQTLNDTVIDKTMQRLMGAFERDLGAIIRK
ncbi:MAG: phenylalanine--tRNA ligase subunit beta [Cytophagales bacterium]|nr:MAG: phenylalanine--tRNA ligase subunit beta [Cytophagales bacterium]